MAAEYAVNKRLRAYGKWHGRYEIVDKTTVEINKVDFNDY